MHKASTLLTVSEVAKILGLKESTVRQWIYMRHVSYVKVGRSVRIESEVIQDLIERGTVPALSTYQRSTRAKGGFNE